ncbi:translation initiation factor IF-2 subunit gamma [Candidatus Micrarchaeota archaeon]|nr:translation initiation factor IF-2 subunit gamma [Candidatus Micrarchaeota archaeon]
MQAEVNIGTIGHVDHGKSTLVYSITGKKTDTHSQEIKRGITIKLGYADAAIMKCGSCGKYSVKERCGKCGGSTKPARIVSFVDAPGHETLMATVIAASSVMDGALFVIAANERCPQPQTAEHLMIMEAAGIKNVIIVQNKVDLVPKQLALEHYKEIRTFLKGTPYENSPVVPTAAQSGVNIEAVLQAIQETIPTPTRTAGEKLRMHVVRSFDINRPGTEISKLVGGVLGVAIKSGRLSKGQEIEIRPGVLRVRKGKESYEGIKTKVIDVHAGKSALEEAGPGGLIALATDLDPSLSKADSLVGCLAGPVGSLPPVKSELSVEIKTMPRLLEKFQPTFTPNEPLVLGVGTCTTVGFVTSTKKNKVSLLLKKPVAIDSGDLIAVMRRSQNRWRFYGTAKEV